MFRILLSLFSSRSLFNELLRREKELIEFSRGHDNYGRSAFHREPYYPSESAGEAAKAYREQKALQQLSGLQARIKASTNVEWGGPNDPNGNEQLVDAIMAAEKKEASPDESGSPTEEEYYRTEINYNNGDTVICVNASDYTSLGHRYDVYCISWHNHIPQYILLCGKGSNRFRPEDFEKYNAEESETQSAGEGD